MTETVKILRMSYGPDAIAKLESGKTVFVRGAVPGDIAEVSVFEDRGRYAKASLSRIVEPSPFRVSDTKDTGVKPCLSSVAPWTDLAYEAQLAEKRSIVASALRRTASLPEHEVDSILKDIVPSKKEWGYRNKLELSACKDAQGRFALGFHDAGTDDVEAVSACPLGNRLIEKAPKALTGAIRYLSGSDDLGIYRVGVRGSTNTGSVEIALWTAPSSFPRGFAAKMLCDAVGASSVVRVIADPGSARRVKRVEVLAGDGYWREVMRIDPPSFDEDPSPIEVGCKVSAPSFFQVNTAQACELVGLALEGLGDIEGKSVADLYSGVGTFAIPMLLEGAEVDAIELEGSSARDFRANCDSNGVPAQIVCDDVALALPSLGHLDALVVDPPRSGLDKKVVRQIADAAPGSLVYISCDPQTLARDVLRFRERGFELECVIPVDMFPQTYHVECVSVFARHS